MRQYFLHVHSIDIIYYPVVLRNLVYLIGMYLEKLPFPCWLFVSFHSIRMKRAESHIRFALESTVHLARHISFFLLFFLYFAGIVKHKSTTIANIVLRHAYVTTTSFVFCIPFFILSIADLPVLFNFYWEQVFMNILVKLSSILITKYLCCIVNFCYCNTK